MPFFQLVTMADYIVEGWLAEVRSLPARKQAKWKPLKKPCDKYGCMCQVRYVPEGRTQFGVTSYFEEKISARAAANRDLPEGTWVTIYTVSQRAELFEGQTTTGMDVVRVNLTKNTVGDDLPTHEEHLAEAIGAREANHTGNHRPHQHHVRVPTAPGQPVRA